MNEPAGRSSGVVTGLGAVLWDMDGTLVDSERLWDVSLAELAARLGGSLTPAAREAMVGGSLESSCELVLREVGRPVTSAAVAEAGQWLTARTGELFAADLRWRPGARDALRAARAAGLPAALVTSTHRVLAARALEWIGRDHFDAVVCGDEVSTPKPTPAPYLKAARLLGVPPGGCVAVEDSPIGAASATAAGCVVLVVSSGVPVPAGPGRVHRDGLVGLTAAELDAVWCRASRGGVECRRSGTARPGGGPIRHPEDGTGDTGREPPTAARRPPTESAPRVVGVRRRMPDTCGGRERFR